MDKIEEIRKLKSLRDFGAITEKEYNHLVSKLEPESGNGKNEAVSVNNNQSSLEQVDESMVVGNLTRLPENVVSAGKSIRGAIGWQIASYFFNFLGIILLVVSLSSILSSIMNGRDVEYIISDNPALIASIISIFLGAIFKIVSLSKFSKTGSFLKESESIYYGRNTIKVNPSKHITESNGLVVGQEFAGGIIAFFDKSKKYVGIVAKEDLPEKMNVEQAFAACIKFNSNEYSDWFLPDRVELSTCYQHLHSKQLGNFKEDKYWFEKRYQDFEENNEILFDFNPNPTDSINKKSDLNLVRPMRLVKFNF